MGEDLTVEDYDFVIKDLRGALTRIAGTIAEMNAKKRKQQRWETYCKVVGLSESKGQIGTNR